MLGSFDGFDFLDEEGSHNSRLDASAAENSSVGSADTLVLLSESLVGVGSELSNAVESLSALAGVMGGPGSISPFADVLDDHLGAGSSYFSDLVRLGVIAESASVCHSLNHLW